MTEEAYQQFYEVEYEKLHGGKDGPDDDDFNPEYIRGSEIYAYLGQILGTPPRKTRILEVGCSSGGILQYFKEQGNQVCGCDLNSEYIKFGRANHALNIEVGTIDKVAKLDKSPDIVIYSHVLEHILDPLTELMKLRKVLTWNSLVYIELPGIKNLIRSYQADFLRLLQNAHVYYPTLTALRNILRNAGYDFLYGDEVIHSIFRKGSLRENADFHCDTDYQSTIAFLSKLESTRLLPTPYKMEAYFMTLAPKVLKAVGLYNFARSFYHRIR